MNKTLSEMEAEVLDLNQRKGWYDEPRTFGDEMALLHSEVSEALEAYREAGDSEFWTTVDGGQVRLPAPQGYKPEGVPSEFADVLIRLLDSCARHGVDLENQYELKMAFNRTRPFKHGNKRL